MRPAYITDDFLFAFISTALREDVGDGDHSTMASIPDDKRHSARLLVKDEGILAGIELAGAALDAVDVVAPGEQQFGQVGAVLARDAGDEGGLG